MTFSFAPPCSGPFKGARVELVLGVQDERHVEGLHLVGGGVGAADHVQEVGRVGKVLPGEHRGHPLADPEVVGDGDRDLGE
jgi:hypothetical protein